MTPEEWYLSLANRLQRYAVLKFGIPADDAEGLVHEVFITYLKPPAPIVNARRWFFGAISHACRNYLRKNGRMITGEEIVEEIAEPSHVTRIAVRETLRALPPLERKLLWMQVAEGYTVREIATSIGRSVSFTEKRLRQARLQAADVLEESDDDTHRWLAGRRVSRADTFAST
ncbi:MAG TPA: RNA polymerase sigma factor, partial [Thermoanaerobaculia bacterium]|nr:RNA polymerase sigma factor [Thermoanaerobaculia bacterium]